MQLNNIHHEAAIRMLNEIHERMGYKLVYKLKLEMLAVDKIAEKHIAKAYEAGQKAALQERKPLSEFERMQIIGNEFPLPLVKPLIIQKIDSVCIAIEAAHGIKEQLNEHN